MWLLQDNAPAHRDRRIRNCLNIAFPQTWIGTGRPVQCALRSCLLCGYVNEQQVYRTTSTTSDDMKNWIRVAFCEIGNEMLSFQGNFWRDYSFVLILSIYFTIVDIIDLLILVPIQGAYKRSLHKPTTYSSDKKKTI